MHHDDYDRITDDNNYYEDQQNEEWDRDHRNRHDADNDPREDSFEELVIGIIFAAAIVALIIAALHSH
jgi:hypothetical protein